MSDTMRKDCSLIILAAGYSSRMGSPKFALALNSQTNFLENIINQYFKIGVHHIIVVLNAEGEKYIEQHPLRIDNPVRLIINEHPEYERFYSIKLGLSTVKKESYVFIHPSDLPIILEDTLKMIYLKKEEADFVKPVFNGKGGHPILLSSKIVKDLLNEEKNSWKLNEYLEKYSCYRLDVKEASILDNINTREDYLGFLERISEYK